MKDLLMVGIGGFGGSVLRYLIAIWGSRHFVTAFPVSTLLVNLTGSLLLGLFVGLTFRQSLQHWQILLTVGFCGGFTTFSTFSIESLALIKNGQWSMFVGYVLLSLAGGVLCGLLGGWLAQKIL